jgi:hypothetical protein
VEISKNSLPLFSKKIFTFSLEITEKDKKSHQHKKMETNKTVLPRLSKIERDICNPIKWSCFEVVCGCF